MQPTSDDLAVLDQLAEEFVGRLRRGELPPIQPYADRHPGIARDIQRLFPTLVAMEQVGTATEADGRPLSPHLPARIGDYCIIRKIGEGGMGVVYEAIQESLGRHVALKVLPTHARVSPRFRERFRREAKAAARLQHPNIVPVYGVGEDAGTPYFAMQYIAGHGLDRLTANRTPPDAHGATVTVAVKRGSTSEPGAAAAVPPVERRAEPCQFRWVAEIGAKVADALAYAHAEGVIHRDVKPSNLMLDGNGSVWVTDFGLAKTSEADSLTETGDIIGTIRYMAPERFNGWADARSDVYGLGATLYELVAGRAMFDEADRGKLIHRIINDHPPALRRLNPRVPRDLETAIMKATAKEPADRYPSAAALADDLRRFANDQPIRARRHTWAAHVWLLCRRKPMVAGLAATLAVVMMVLLVGSLIVNVVLNERGQRITEAQGALKTQLTQLEEARGREADATAEANRQLLHALRREADASRWSRRPGSRHEALEAIAKIPALSAKVPLDAQEKLAIRNLAIGSLALMDVQADPGAVRRIPPKSSFTPDLSHYVTLDAEPRVVVRRYADGEAVATLPLPAVPNGLSFSPAGPTAIVRIGRQPGQNTSNTLIVWDWGKNKVLWELPGYFEGGPWSIRPDGDEVAIGHLGGAIEFRAMADGAVRRTLARRGDPAIVLYHPSGQRLAIVERNGARISVIRAVGGEVLYTAATPTSSNLIMGINWSPDGRFLGAVCANNRGYVWHAETGRHATDLVGHQAEVTRIEFERHGAWVATGSWDGTTRFWDPVTGSHLLTYPALVTAVAADGRRLAYDRDHAGGILAVTGLAEFRALKGHTTGKGPWHVAFDPSGRTLASAGIDGLQFWDAATGEPAGQFDAAGLLTVLFHPDGKHVITAGQDRVAVHGLTWDAAGTTATMDPGTTMPVGGTGLTERRATLSADGARLAVSNLRTQQIAVFPFRDEKLLRTMSLPWVAAPLLSPDGRWLLGTTWPVGGVRVWDARTSQQVADVPVGMSAQCAFSPDSRRLAVCNKKGGEIWSTETWAKLADLPALGDSPGAGSPVYSPDGRILVVTRRANLDIQLLDAETLEEIARLESPDPQSSHRMAFSPDGSQLAIACATRVVHVWDLRAIRQKLAELGLDWDHPPYPAPAPRKGPIRIRGASTIP